MTKRNLALVTSFTVLLFFTVPVRAQTNQGPGQFDESPDMTTDLQDPVVELQRIRQRRVISRDAGDSLFRTSPFTPFQAENNRGGAAFL